jgi:hypothetical protein
VTSSLPPFCAIVSALVCSCASPKELHLRDLAALELGRSKGSESVKVFGEPASKRTRVNAAGTFEIIVYGKRVDHFAGGCYRVLLLEFKDGVFNAYLSGSSCEDDRTSANAKAVPEIAKGIGELSKSDVIAAMGEPSGKAHCPSAAPDYEGACVGAIEVWAWLGIPERAAFGPLDRSATLVVVAFDQQGRVVDAYAEQTQSQRSDR